MFSGLYLWWAVGFGARKLYNLFMIPIPSLGQRLTEGGLYQADTTGRLGDSRHLCCQLYRNQFIFHHRWSCFALPGGVGLDRRGKPVS
uniref:Putative secreted protein n=1 Tax=Anopheles marajoara TaxID=58244 RepID=A0A2M4CAS8_9DIPT